MVRWGPGLRRQVRARVTAGTCSCHFATPHSRREGAAPHSLTLGPPGRTAVRDRHLRRRDDQGSEGKQRAGHLCLWHLAIHAALRLHGK